MGISISDVRDARDVSESFTDLKTKEYKGDVAIVLNTARGDLGVIVEVQRRKADDKQWTWPLYIATLRNRQRCPVILLVIAPDPAVAEWCAQTIDIGHPGHSLTPLVLGHDHVPVIEDPQEIVANPAMGVVSALFHGSGQRSASVLRAIVGGYDLLAEKSTDQAGRYYDFVLAVLPAEERRTLEAMVMTESRYYSVPFREAEAKGWAKGEAEGRAEGEAKGRAEGEAKGEAKGRAADVLEILEVREIPVTDAQRERIVECSDPTVLKGWVRRAVVVETAEELFG